MTRTLRLTALLGALAVALGAFGAHGLQQLVEPADILTFNTGVRYHFYHVFALGLAVLLADRPGYALSRLKAACWAWGLGILLFSGSLYLLALSDLHAIPTGLLGPITPLGGLCFIAGWILLFLSPKTNAV